MAAETLQWAEVAAAGGIRNWVDAELRRQGLLDPSDTSKLSDEQRKQYKARREEERRVRKELYRRAWGAYRRAHLVHLGKVFYHDTADIDRFDIEDPGRRLQENGLPELKDAQSLSAALALAIPRLRWLTYHRDVDSGTHYHRWLIPKRDGGQRLISAPKPDLKKAQKWLAASVTEHLPVHGAVHGFLAGRGTRSNATVHAGAKIVVHMDIKDFYPSITLPRVKGLLRKAGYGEQVATVMALLCTESPRDAMPLRGKIYYVATGPRSLPQGAPTSPSITNTICLRMDCRLAGLARVLKCRYSRYADDLTFSWHGPDADAAAKENLVGRLLKASADVVRAEGFRLHAKKTRVMRGGSKQEITGLVVNPAPGRPAARVPRSFVRKLRAALHNRRLGKPGQGETLEQLRGWAAYVMMTDPERGRGFMAKIDELQSAATLKQGEQP
jgi:hypothetical protein